MLFSLTQCVEKIKCVLFINKLRAAQAVLKLTEYIDIFSVLTEKGEGGKVWR